jgi:tRNA threonylcarbamoyladenosine biosynthesis protein TsaE
MKCPQDHQCPAIAVCPKGAISQSDINALPRVDDKLCVQCGLCMKFCPKGAFEKLHETHSPTETFELGKRLGEEAKRGGFYALYGDLGVGKTVFSQGFAAGLGVREVVTSPTFTILQPYESGRMPFYHFDCYRISSAIEMDDLGYEEFFYGDGVCLVEWSERIEAILPRNRVVIQIEKEFEKGDDYRKINICNKHA